MRSHVACALLVVAIGVGLSSQTGRSPDIPRTWDANALAALEVPLPNPEFSPKAVAVDYYDRIPVRKILSRLRRVCAGQGAAGLLRRSAAA
jgi:hypothetical protein